METVENKLRFSTVPTAPTAGKSKIESQEDLNNMRSFTQNI
jgi:hypothetical protein